MADPSNPFLEASPLPYRLPLFALVRPEHYREAIELGMREQRAEVEAVAADPAPPTFENTLEALERSGELLRRVLPVFENASSADTDEAIDALEAEFAPRLAAHRDAIRLDPRLFARIGVLHGMRDELGLEPDAVLPARAHAPRGDPRGRGARSRPSANDSARAQRADLDAHDGVPEEPARRHERPRGARHRRGRARRPRRRRAFGRARGGRRPRARRAGSSPSCCPPVSPHSPRSRTRPCATGCSPHRARADAAAASTTTASALLEIVRLRAERAALLGFANHAAAVTADETAGTPEAVAALLAELAAPAMRNVARERASSPSGPTPPAHASSRPADWAFLRREGARRASTTSTSRRCARTSSSSACCSDGVFHAATLLVRRPLHRARRPRRLPPRRARLRGARRGRHAGRPLPPRPVHPRLEARRRVDELARLAVRAARRPAGRREQPQRAQAGARRADAADVRRGRRRSSTSSGTRCTASSRGCAYPKLAGTNVYRDFVEFPSQVNEMWMLLARGARRTTRCTTRRASRCRRSSSTRSSRRAAFNAGLRHQRVPRGRAARPGVAPRSTGDAAAVTDVAAFEAAALAAAGLAQPARADALLEHVLRARVRGRLRRRVLLLHLERGARRRHRRRGSRRTAVLTRENGDRFRREILAPGGSRDPRRVDPGAARARAVDRAAAGASRPVVIR